MDMNETVASTCELTMQECLTCYLCGDMFRRPRVLPCGHTFCSECLARQKDEILGNGHYQRGEAPAEIYDSSDWLRPSDHNSRQKRRPHSSPGGSSRNSDDSSNVDFLDSDPSCYRPHSYGKHQFSRSDPGKAYQPVPKGVARTGTFVRQRPKSASESSQLGVVALYDSKQTSKACSHCGHDYSSLLPQKCKVPQRASSVRDKSPKRYEGSKPRWVNSPQKTATSAPVGSFEQKHGREMEYFVCPLPECNYSIRIMNLARWSPRNKTVADVSAVWRHMCENKQDASTQTDVSTNQSFLVTIPRSLVDSQSMQTLGHRRRHSSMVDMAIHSAVSMDSLDSGYIPRGHLNWRSYAAMVGMNILQQTDALLGLWMLTAVVFNARMEYCLSIMTLLYSGRCNKNTRFTFQAVVRSVDGHCFLNEKYKNKKAENGFRSMSTDPNGMPKGRASSIHTFGPLAVLQDSCTLLRLFLRDL